eukprot:Lithocolla_globosa_v1_NODE_1336_length_2662_cov_7.344074.p5 type:complete len:108 gc:universal NODE_1336_length_2662_cov_7.344074:512-189(-)
MAHTLVQQTSSLLDYLGVLTLLPLSPSPPHLFNLLTTSRVLNRSNQNRLSPPYSHDTSLEDLLTYVTHKLATNPGTSRHLLARCQKKRSCFSVSSTPLNILFIHSGE